jgi:hypothetical protein
VGCRYCLMGCSGDQHRSPGHGIPVHMRLETLGPCALPDEIPFPSASPGSGRLGRRLTQGYLTAKRQIQSQKSGIETPYNPLRQHLLPTSAIRLHFHKCDDHTSNHVAPPTHKTGTSLLTQALGQQQPVPSWVPTISPTQTLSTSTLYDTLSRHNHTRPLYRLLSSSL